MRKGRKKGIRRGKEVSMGRIKKGEKEQGKGRGRGRVKRKEKREKGRGEDVGMGRVKEGEREEERVYRTTGNEGGKRVRKNFDFDLSRLLRQKE